MLLVGASLTARTIQRGKADERWHHRKRQTHRLAGDQLTVGVAEFASRFGVLLLLQVAEGLVEEDLVFKVRLFKS
jgi:hypothetical protein